MNPLLTWNSSFTGQTLYFLLKYSFDFSSHSFINKFQVKCFFAMFKINCYKPNQLMWFVWFLKVEIPIILKVLQDSTLITRVSTLKPSVQRITEKVTYRWNRKVRHMKTVSIQLIDKLKSLLMGLPFFYPEWTLCKDKSYLFSYLGSSCSLFLFCSSSTSLINCILFTSVFCNPVKQQSDISNQFIHWGNNFFSHRSSKRKLEVSVWNGNEAGRRWRGGNKKWRPCFPFFFFP